MLDPSGIIRRQEPAQIEVPAGQVRVLESHHATDFRMDLGQWSFHKICWVAVGGGFLESGERRVSIGRDDFLLLPADYAHRFVDHPGEPLTLVILCISESYFQHSPSTQLTELWKKSLSGRYTGNPLCARTAFHRSSLIEAFRLALREQENLRVGWETALQLIAGRLLLAFGRSHCETREIHAESSLRTVEGAIDYIDSHINEALQIGDMAERCRLSPRRFTTLFKQLTGRTFSQYLNEQRIQYACRRLEETGHILYACHESGFNDVAYFYRVFKKFKGESPGEYLKSSAGSHRKRAVQP